MTIAVLPFNAGPNTNPGLARQFANFIGDIVRNLSDDVEINAVNYLARTDESPNARLVFMNPSEGLNEIELMAQLFEQTGADKAMDGLLVANGTSNFEISYRLFDKGNENPVLTENESFLSAGVFNVLRKAIETLAAAAGVPLTDEMKSDEGLFGTTDPEAFLKFIEGYDALQYIDRTQGQVIPEFDPAPGMQSLLDAVEKDNDWEAPYIALVQLSRAATNFRIGNGENVEKYLKILVDQFPKDGRALFALGEFYAAVGNASAASDTFEKAHVLEPEEPAILTRLGISQMEMGMPVNAERNFRKAIEMEGEEKPSVPFLAQVLQQTNRGHEVPGLWKSIIDSNPQNVQANANYAISLIEAGNKEEGEKAFEHALNSIEDNALIKRYYAPFLANEKKDFDRAMDMYEDVLDVAPTEIPVMLEYAQTLALAEREFEIPKVLKDVLNANPDVNTRAQTLAWLTELEQPKRVEIVTEAQKKMEAGDFESALKDLRPMQNWLSDYWKMWALLAACLNRTEDYVEGEKAATALINLFPGCEPAYGEIATALGGQGKHEEAYNAMRFGASQVQNSLGIAVNLALAAKRTGREDEARGLSKQIREAVGANVDPGLIQVLDDLDR